MHLFNEAKDNTTIKIKQITTGTVYPLKNEVRMCNNATYSTVVLAEGTADWAVIILCIVFLSSLTASTLIIIRAYYSRI